MKAYQFALDFLDLELIPETGEKGAKVVPPEVAQYQRELEELQRKNREAGAKEREAEGGLAPEDPRYDPKFDPEADRAWGGRRRTR